MVARYSRGNDFYQAQFALLAVIGLQLVVSNHFSLGSKYLICILEVLLVLGIGLLAPLSHPTGASLRRALSLVLIAFISVVNIGSLFLVSHALIYGNSVHGIDILTAALAIFLTNVIIFSIWYWEIDSPGLTGYQRHHSKPKFLFPQMAIASKHQSDSWEPSYIDYLYVSVTNATAFSPTDTMPLTHGAKLLMGTQALVSLLTLALVAARAVNILA